MTMPLRPAAPGFAKQFQIRDSGISDGKCDACESRTGNAEYQKVNGVLFRLCTNVEACCQRYRWGLTPNGYAAMLREGTMP